MFCFVNALELCLLSKYTQLRMKVYCYLIIIPNDFICYVRLHHRVIINVLSLRFNNDLLKMLYYLNVI